MLLARAEERQREFALLLAELGEPSSRSSPVVVEILAAPETTPAEPPSTSAASPE
jgi:hypothetical protein